MDNNKTGALVGAKVEAILADYEADPKNAIVRHALSRSSLTNVAYDSSSEAKATDHFSVEVKTLSVTNQKRSGRCWIFAGLNFLREFVAKELDLKAFEFSQNYISLYDKIEKANFALESVIKLCPNEPTERVFMHVLGDPISDGGQWDMFVNLVKKYGLMPKDAFPETAQSNETAKSNFLVNAAIRDFAHKAHELYKAGKEDEIRPLKEATIAKIYQFYLNAFGVPPKTFDFEYADSKEVYHVERGFTPKSFFEKYIGNRIDDFQSLINSPTEDKPFNRNFTVDFLGNVVEGKPINHLNVEMERMKELIVAQLKDGVPVWFGSDVSFYRDADGFAWNSGAYDYVSSYGMDVKFEKSAMLDFRHSAMNHAMVITGVDIVDGVPAKWKIENSWGNQAGLNGYFVMDAAWFDRFVYQAVIDRKYLNDVEKDATGKDPIHLDPWDPMGTLAD
ncbi:MAG: C1 family peptidase [Bacilli bacterium]|nr:C1 family peptidase [Bacilli bacterium]